LIWSPTDDPPLTWSAPGLLHSSNPLHVCSNLLSFLDLDALEAWCKEQFCALTIVSLRLPSTDELDVALKTWSLRLRLLPRTGKDTRRYRLVVQTTEFFAKPWCRVNTDPKSCTLDIFLPKVLPAALLPYAKRQCFLPRCEVKCPWLHSRWPVWLTCASETGHGAEHCSGHTAIKILRRTPRAVPHRVAVPVQASQHSQRCHVRRGRLNCLGDVVAVDERRRFCGCCGAKCSCARAAVEGLPLSQR